MFYSFEKGARLPTAGHKGPMAVAAVAPRRSVMVAVPTLVLFVAVASFWAMNTVAMRVGGRSVPPLTVAACRSVIGAVVLLGVARGQGADRPRGRAE